MINLKTNIDLLRKSGGNVINKEGVDTNLLFAPPSNHFTEVQNIAYNGINYTEYFSIDGVDYLFAPIKFDANNSPLTNSILYKWDGTSLIEHQLIQTTGAVHGNFFTIGFDKYIFISQNYNEVYNWSTNSKLYKWDGNNFILLQDIQTNGANYSSHKNINGVDYLMISNSYDNVTTNINSELFVWDGFKFVLDKAFPTKKCLMNTFHTIGSNEYLFLPSSYDETTLSYNNTIDIYKFDGTTFILEQSINSTNPTFINAFEISGDTYILSSNSRTSLSRNVDQILYKFDGANFVQLQTLLTNFSSVGSRFFIHNNLNYLLVSFNNDNNGQEGSSILYRWSNNKFIIADIKHSSTGIIDTVLPLSTNTYIFSSNLEKTVDINSINSKLYQFTAPLDVLTIPIKKERNLLGISTVDTLDILGDNSCISLYRFNGNLLDDSGSNNAVSNGIVSYIDGFWNKYLRIQDGLNNFVTIAPANIINDDESHSMSIWIKGEVNNIPFFGNHGLLDANTVGGGYGFGFEDGAIVSNTYVVDSGIFSNEIPVYIGLTKGLRDGILVILNVEPDIFNNITYTYNGYKFTVYKNGIERISIPYTKGFTSGTYPIIAGNLNSYTSLSDTSSQNLNIEQVRIFNKSLRESEVITVFKEEK